MNFHVRPAEGEPFEFTLTSEFTVVGRSSTADLALQDPFLSRQHCRLHQVGETLTVEDLGSRNGTYVNSRRIEGPTFLHPGDEIRVSASLIHLEGGSRSSVTKATTIDTDSGATIYRPARGLLEADAESSSEQLDSAEALRKYAEKLEILKDVHEVLALSMDTDAVLHLVLDRAFDHLEPEQGVIYLREEDGEFYEVATRSVPGKGKSIPLSKVLVAEVRDKGMAALVRDAVTDQRFKASESILLSGVRSMLAAPLLDENGAIGMVVLSSTIATRQFDEADLELLVSLASVAALKIRNTALAAGAARTLALEAELNKARKIQVRLLSRPLPSPQGYVLLGRNVPHHGVSGDFYRVISRNDDQECVLFLADVSGKGMDASLLTMSLEALVTSPVDSGDPPDKICEILSQRLFEMTAPEKYATAFVVVLDHASGRLLYTNAGHNRGLLVHSNGEIDELDPCGVPIGLFPDATYEARDAQLDPGGTLLVYTDGITEAETSDGEEYGLERLRESLLRSRELVPEALAETLEKDLLEFVGDNPFNDDRTLLILQRAPISD